MVDNTQNILIEHFNQFITHFIISIESVDSKRDEIKWNNNISIRVTKKSNDSLKYSCKRR